MIKKHVDGLSKGLHFYPTSTEEEEKEVLRLFALRELLEQGKVFETAEEAITALQRACGVPFTDAPDKSLSLEIVNEDQVRVYVALGSVNRAYNDYTIKDLDQVKALTNNFWWNLNDWIEENYGINLDLYTIESVSEDGLVSFKESIVLRGTSEVLDSVGFLFDLEAEDFLWESSLEEDFCAVKEGEGLYVDGRFVCSLTADNLYRKLPRIVNVLLSGYFDRDLDPPLSAEQALRAALLINDIPFGLEDTKWSSEDGSLRIEAKDGLLYLNLVPYPMVVFFKYFERNYSLVRANRT